MSSPPSRYQPQPKARPGSEAQPGSPTNDQPQPKAQPGSPTNDQSGSQAQPGSPTNQPASSQDARPSQSPESPPPPPRDELPPPSPEDPRVHKRRKVRKQLEEATFWLKEATEGVSLVYKRREHYEAMWSLANGEAAEAEKTVEEAKKGLRAAEKVRDMMTKKLEEVRREVHRANGAEFVNVQRVTELKDELAALEDPSPSICILSAPH